MRSRSESAPRWPTIPLLTARDLDPPPRRQPKRVVFDAHARLPLDSALVGSIDEAPLIVITVPGADAERSAALEAAGAEVVPVGGDGSSQIAAALDELGRREITSVLLEGGPTLAGAFLDSGEIDQLCLFVAPVVIGGRDAHPALGGRGPEAMADAQRALEVDYTSVGGDLLIDARLREW